MDEDQALIDGRPTPATIAAVSQPTPEHLRQDWAAHAQESQKNRELLFEAWGQAKQLIVNAECWHGYSNEFRELAEMQGRLGSRLVTRVDWANGWQRIGGDRPIAMRFELVAARAGRALGGPGWRKPSDFWQDCVLFYLEEADQRRAFYDASGLLKFSVVASEELCLWLAAQAVAVRVKALPAVDLFATPDMRESAIAAYIQAEGCTRKELATRCGVVYQDLNTWKLHRHEKFSKNGSSDKAKRIEDELRRVLS